MWFLVPISAKCTTDLNTDHVA